MPLKLVTPGGGAHCPAPSPQGKLDPALRSYILLITILVAFLEATAQQLTPFHPPVVLGFSGMRRQEPGV